ncbi:hypothetical protein L3Q82_002730 [Scortum barcoo]|uniref:Uncharacterized protein n=1 Tax=Scortum barcoo TaxID=214431 RepID=A0ACB8VUF5_9TELE|nr:hypothetical protein L3Q82_002730 [Scortum barcoo]
MKLLFPWKRKREENGKETEVEVPPADVSVVQLNASEEDSRMPRKVVNFLEDLDTKALTSERHHKFASTLDMAFFWFCFIVGIIYFSTMTYVMVGPGFLLMQDNARPHVAGVCQQFLQDEGIDAMDWPARCLWSPDLNPIEHMGHWDIMSRSIHQCHVAPQTVQELADALVQVWEEILSGDHPPPHQEHAQAL